MNQLQFITTPVSSQQCIRNNSQVMRSNSSNMQYSMIDLSSQNQTSQSQALVDSNQILIHGRGSHESVDRKYDEDDVDILIDDNEDEQDREFTDVPASSTDCNLQSGSFVPFVDRNKKKSPTDSHISLGDSDSEGFVDVVQNLSDNANIEVLTLSQEKDNEGRKIY